MKRKLGCVGSTALASVRERPVLTEAESSLALLPEARAVRKSVLRKRFSGEANSISKSGEEKVSRTWSMDHCGILLEWRVA